MNHYIRTIGSMLIFIIYSMLAAFLFIDKVFVNIIYFQGMFDNTQIFGIPAFLFLNLIIHIIVYYYVGSVFAYKINQQK